MVSSVRYPKREEGGEFQHRERELNKDTELVSRGQQSSNKKPLLHGTIRDCSIGARDFKWDPVLVPYTKCPQTGPGGPDSDDVDDVSEVI
jgi:hypothetical protein